MNSRIRAFLLLPPVVFFAGYVILKQKAGDPRIDGILMRPSAQSNEWSVLITNPNGKVRYQRNPSQSLMPASNEKLFTVSGAIGLLGTNHSFETRIYLNGQLADGVLNGDANLVCEHDITWNPAVFPTNTAAPLEHIAARLKERGLKSVLGTVQCYGACFFNPDGNNRMHDPLDQEEYNREAAVAFKKALSAAGILVSTNAPVGNSGFAAPGSLFYTHESSDMLFDGEPLNLQTVCIPILKQSENVMADGLLRHVGYRTRGDDSYLAGAVAVGGWLSTIAKINTNALSIADGSGLSRKNACSAAQLVSLLRYVMNKEPALVSALPIACKDGTLTDRFCKTAAAGKVHAKTGTLKVCSALSGFVEDANGTPQYIFSIIANHRGTNDPTLTRQIIDDAVTELVVQQ